MYQPRFARRQPSLRALAALLLALLMALPPASALAQTGAPTGALTIESATLRLWPEYDDPGLLVILSGTFAPAGAFPQQVTFPLPAGARSIQATVNDGSGRLLTQEYQVTNGKLVYTLPGPAFHIEYYVDRPPSGEQRNLSYTFGTDYPIGQLTVETQQPARAAGFTLTPAPEGTPVTNNGFTVYTLRRSNLAAGATVPLALAYTKPDQSTSVEPAAQTQPTVAPAPLTQPAQAPTAASALPYLLIGIGLVGLAGAAIYWLLLQQRAASPSPRTGGGGTNPRVAQQPEARGQGSQFCPKCGQRYSPADQFCARCGAPRRK